MVNPTWEERDLPVLQAAVEICEEAGGRATAAAIAQRCGFDDQTVDRALKALRHEQPPPFRDLFVYPGGAVMHVTDPTGEARRRVGLWPTPDSLADRIVAAFEQAAEREPDPEKKGWLRKTAEYLASTGRDIAVEVAAAVIARQTGA